MAGGRLAFWGVQGLGFGVQGWGYLLKGTSNFENPPHGTFPKI